MLTERDAGTHLADNRRNTVQSSSTVFSHQQRGYVNPSYDLKKFLVLIGFSKGTVSGEIYEFWALLLA